MQIIAVTGLLLVTACGEEKSESQPNAQVSAEDVKRESREAYEAMSVYAVRKRDEFQKRMAEQIASYQEQMDALKARATEATEAAREKFNDTAERFKQQQETVQTQLQKLKSASVEAWEGMEKNIQSAMDDLEKRYEEAKDTL